MHISTCPKNFCHPSRAQYWSSSTAVSQGQYRDLQRCLTQSQSAWHDLCAEQHGHRTCNHTLKLENICELEIDSGDTV